MTTRDRIARIIHDAYLPDKSPSSSHMAHARAAADALRYEFDITERAEFVDPSARRVPLDEP